MIKAFQGWSGKVEIDGILYDSIKNVSLDSYKHLDPIHIKLYPNRLEPERVGGNKVDLNANTVTEYRITVKKYMTREATPEFDFMQKWNNNIPMPLRTMTGTKEKETRGMVYMKLHGDMWAEKICTCMKCGRALTNPVSQYFGIGPECGGHNYVNPFNSDEELKAAVDSYKKELRAITWEGWIIKSAITEEVEVNVA